MIDEIRKEISKIGRLSQWSTTDQVVTADGWTIRQDAHSHDWIVSWGRVQWDEPPTTLARAQGGWLLATLDDVYNTARSQMTQLDVRDYLTTRAAVERVIEGHMAW